MFRQRGCAWRGGDPYGKMADRGSRIGASCDKGGVEAVYDGKLAHQNLPVLGLVEEPPSLD